MKKSTLLMIFVAILLTSCVDNPLDKIKEDLKMYDEYSVVLKDMREESEFPQYRHLYQVVGIRHAPKFSAEMKEAMNEVPEDRITQYTTEWLPVPEDIWRKYESNLGMTILSKTAEGESDVSQPAGYQYVGNPRYGQWVQRDGGSFWEFYGKYRMFTDVLDVIRGPVYYGDWDDYRGHRQRGRPYYGRNKQYGTMGSHTKKSNPGFFQRRQAKELQRKQNFKNRFNQRVSRSSSSGYRSRSSGFGK